MSKSVNRRHFLKHSVLAAGAACGLAWPGRSSQAWPARGIPVSPPEGIELTPTCKPLYRLADLDRGESQKIILSDGSTANVKLLDVREITDSICGAVRQPLVTVQVNGKEITLTSANYHLPVTIGGVQIDCPVTKGYSTVAHSENEWGIFKDARLRLWPEGSPWMPEGQFTYPVGQRWFANETQMGNDPVFVDGCEEPGNKNIYYHYGLDFGGVEDRVPIYAATDGIVTIAGEYYQKDLASNVTSYAASMDWALSPRYCNVYLYTPCGWHCCYSHLSSIDPAVKVGASVKTGQFLGLLGEEGASGGWSHLHVDFLEFQPSGYWGYTDAYPFAWEAYRRQYDPDLIAVARPHKVGWTGEDIELDASQSWAKSGPITSYEWTFSDGSKANTAKTSRSYSQPGNYSEILKITDSRGNVDYDFATVQIFNREQPEKLPPRIHACHYPSINLQVGQPIHFKVRAFSTQNHPNTWDFGDGTDPVTVSSYSPDQKGTLYARGYGTASHKYSKPGTYLATVTHQNEHGYTAAARLRVQID